jgi:SAM-dependent methyltransferase
MTLAAEWERYYQTDLALQSQQNARITRDFAVALKDHLLIVEVINASRHIIGIGCGTGELCSFLARRNGAKVLGIDLSQTAIAYARQYQGKDCSFGAMSFNDPSLTRAFDLAVSSNVLEHFGNWRGTLTRWLEIAPRVLVLVPYRETWPMGRNRHDGGKAHVSKFDEHTFTGFRLLDWFTFATQGWQVGKNPLQMAALLEAQS